MLGAGVIAPTIPLYGRTLGATGIWLGIIYSAFSVSRAVFMPVAGKFSDLKGRKVFITMGLTIYTLASLGYIWSASVGQLIWIRFLHGVGSAMVVPIAAAAIGDISPKGKEGSIMGSFNVALFLGYGAGPLLGGFVHDALGMAEVFYLMGGLSCVSLFLVIFFMPEKKNLKQKELVSVSPFLTIWNKDIFKGLFLFRMSNAALRGSVTVFLPIFATQVDASPSQIGVLVSLNILLAAALQHFFGRLADRWNRYFLIVLGNLLTAAPLLFTPFADNYLHLIVLSTIMGVGSSLAFPAASAVATDLGRIHGMGNIMGFYNQAMSLGMIMGPVTAGWIMDLFGIHVVFIFGGLIGVFGSTLCGHLFFHNRGILTHANV